MERAQRVREIWSWLPAFRAVAETEHLPSAARALHVGPSSLSRAVGLLEDAVGRPLFDRVGRRIVLNDAGRELLSAVRLAMRSVDDAVTTLGPGQMVGRVTIHVPGPMAPLLVLPALARLSARHPRLVPVVTSVPTARVPHELHAGRLDVAVVEGAVPAQDLAVEALLRVPHAVCAGPTHPLARACHLTPQDLAEHPFVAPIPAPDGTVPDRWPPGWPRRIGLHVLQMQVALEACRAGTHLAVLPWPVAERAGLVRLPVEGIDGAVWYAIHRPDLPTTRRTRAVVAALRRRAADLQRAAASPS